MVDSSEVLSSIFGDFQYSFPVFFNGIAADERLFTGRIAADEGREEDGKENES